MTDNFSFNASKEGKFFQANCERKYVDANGRKMIRFYFDLTLFFLDINFVALGSLLKAHRSNLFFLVAS